MTRVLMVCVGNICRSPLAEGLLAARAGSQGVAVEVSSAGVDALAGDPMDPLAAAELAARGGSATGFTARQLTPQMVAEADLVLVATKGVRARVLGFDPGAMRRTFTLTELAALAPLVGETPAAAEAPAARITAAARLRARVAREELDLRDPYGCEAGVHAEVATRVEAAVDAVLALLSPHALGS